MFGLGTIFSWIWGNSTARTALLYIGIALAVMALVLVIWFRGKSAGKVEVIIDGLKNTLEREREIRDAQANSPRDRDGVVKRMRDGTF